jgi:hypothetical protein
MGARVRKEITHITENVTATVGICVDPGSGWLEQALPPFRRPCGHPAIRPPPSMVSFYP